MLRCSAGHRGGPWGCSVPTMAATIRPSGRFVGQQGRSDKISS